MQIQILHESIHKYINGYISLKKNSVSNSAQHCTQVMHEWLHEQRIVAGGQQKTASHWLVKGTVGGILYSCTWPWCSFMSHWPQPVVGSAHYSRTQGQYRHISTVHTSYHLVPLCTRHWVSSTNSISNMLSSNNSKQFISHSILL